MNFYLYLTHTPSKPGITFAGKYKQNQRLLLCSYGCQMVSEKYFLWRFMIIWLLIYKWDLCLQRTVLVNFISMEGWQYIAN